MFFTFKSFCLALTLSAATAVAQAPSAKAPPKGACPDIAKEDVEAAQKAVGDKLRVNARAPQVLSVSGKVATPEEKIQAEKALAPFCKSSQKCGPCEILNLLRVSP